MKKADKILIVCIMIVAVVLCVPLFFSKNENAYASVYVKEKQVLRIDLSKDKTYVVNGKLGKVHIEVKQKKSACYTRKESTSLLFETRLCFGCQCSHCMFAQ